MTGQRKSSAVASALAALSFGLCACSATAATWTVMGPPGANVSALAVDPSNHQVVYAGVRCCSPGELFKSVDGGTTWALANLGITGPDVTSIALKPGTPSTLYAVAGGAVYQSLDGSATWQRLAGLPAQYSFDHVLVRPDQPNALYAVGPYGPYLSADAGQTWTAIGLSDAFSPPTLLAIAPGSPSTLYAANASGYAYQSTDGGLTWGSQSSDQLLYEVLTLAVDPGNSARVYAGTAGGLYVSSDSANHWSAVSGGLPLCGFLSLALGSGAVFAGTDKSGIYKSSDGGTTWSQANAGVLSQGVLAVVQDPAVSSVLYAGTLAGVSKTLNKGASWADAGTADIGRRGGPVVVDPRTSERLYAGSVAGLYKSEDRGVTWSHQSLGSPDPGASLIAIDPNSPDTLFAAVQSPVPAWPGEPGPYLNTIVKTTDGGQTWSGAGSGLDNFVLVGIRIDPTDSSTVYAASHGGVYKSTNGGSSWTQVNDGLDETFVTSVLVDPVSHQTIYASTSGYVYKSLDGGAHWASLPDAYRTQMLESDPGNGDLLAGGEYGFLRSRDGGATWTDGNAGLPPSPSIEWLAVNASNPDFLFVSAYSATSPTMRGLFGSSNGGDSWYSLNYGLPSRNVGLITVDGAGGFIYLPLSDGVYGANLGDLQPFVQPTRPPGRAIPSRPSGHP
jgi:photosystem II stability/assembly factor-like uncharacterized protein